MIALEGRSFVVSVYGLLRTSDIPDETPLREQILEHAPELLASGGSAVAAPNGEWLSEPAAPEERIFTVEIDHRRVREERQNLDVAGHYARPDVTRLVVNRSRQATVEFE